MLTSLLLATTISVYLQVLFSEAWDCGRQIIRNRGGHRVGRAVGGNVARAGSWPWHVLLKHSSGASCGGAIISKRIVVTAAHCFLNRFLRKPFSDRTNRTAWTVYLGKWRSNINDPHEKIHSVDAINFAPNYRGYFPFDFAAIHVTPMIVFNDYTQPVCLPQLNVSLAPGTMCYLTGWGMRRDSVNWSGESSEVYVSHLRQAYVPIVNRLMCKHFYPPEQPYGWVPGHGDKWRNITDYHLCAGYTDRVYPGACFGDSGGPLVCQKSDRWYLAGILQGANGCHGIGLDIYANVSHYMWYYGSLI